MHTGLLRDRDGKLVPRRIINRFTARFEGDVVISVDLKRAVSADPYFEFEMVVPESGDLVFEWVDDDGSVYRLGKRVVVG